MRHKIRIHYDNKRGFHNPVLWMWVGDGTSLERELIPTGKDDFGVYFDIAFNRSSFNFKFKDGRGEKVDWEEKTLDRYYYAGLGKEVWAMSDRHNLYSVLPASPLGTVKDYYRKIKSLIPNQNFYLPETDVSGLNMPSMLGANLLTDGSIVFGLFHPRAARVYLCGNFNDWQCPGHSCPQEEEFIEMGLYRGYYFQPNIWLVRLTPPQDLSTLEYKFFLQGGAVENERYVTDPYTRAFSNDFKHKNSVVVDPTRFKWTDSFWKTPQVKDLILYELNVYGFTDNDPAIPEEGQGTFKGIIQRIREGYFNRLGVTAIALMPVTEAPVKGGLGYEPCTFMSVEKDFGTPDDFRDMVNTAHEHGLAIIVDKVFNHTSNDFNPLWNLIDDGSKDGGFYFSGATMWGNKVATGKEEVDNMLIDSCKLFIREYHVDGFRFDATHSYFLNHRLLHRIAHEIKDKGFKPDAILIAENLPNERDLNLEGYNGYAQWSDIFHDKIKALLREGEFEGVDNSVNNLGTIIYFSKDDFAAHTNNVVNYCESHDENSVQYEVATGGQHLQDSWIKDRKARLGLMTTMASLGQPMIYMGQEYGIERERNRIDVNWPRYSEGVSRFYTWAQGIINLRQKLEAMKLSGFNPMEEGKFSWVLGPWMEERRGGKHRVIGWRAEEKGEREEKLLIMLNFEGFEARVDLQIEVPGRWVRLADINHVYNGRQNPKDLRERESIVITDRGLVTSFTLPPYSGFIYQHYPLELN